jgi:glycine/D-amino acid oxidase-like deaminating enzyme/nitrite reductase/ring-hydroxylating ferredoxin subunit
MNTNEQLNQPETTGVLRERDGQNISLWQTGIPSLSENKAQFSAEKIYDALIVGAGITGLTAAIILQKSGLNCILADAHTVGYGTTGGTTAHINTFADTTYDEVEKNFSKDASKMFATAIAEANAIIKDFASQYQIDCDLETKQAFVYAEDEKQAEELDSMYEASLRAGVSVRVAANAPAPVPYLKAIEYDAQSQFHPLKYITGLQKEFVASGGVVLENTRIEEVDTEELYHIAVAANAKIKTKKVLYATHIPPGGINVLHFLNAPYRSYVVAAKLTGEQYPDALIYDMQEPYHYIRTHVIEGQKYLIVGGCDHKTGHGEPDQAFADLESYVRKYYPVASVDYHWSSQYYVPADGLPYVGPLPGTADGILAATGYNGNGMILGTIAGKVLADLAREIESSYADLFDTKRIKPIASATEVIKENADVTFKFFADRFSVDEIKSLNDLQPDHGLVGEFSGEKVAVYKDKEGVISALSPVCTHAKCIVDWNNAEKSWDCPCHGGRFDTLGNVLTGPPRKNLEKVTLLS